MKYWHIIIITLVLWSCREDQSSNKVIYKNYEFAILENKPIFEDEYLFEKGRKKCRIEKVNNITIYQCDWNNNNKYNEQGIDYIGVKSRLENKPILEILDSVIYINQDGQKYSYKHNKTKKLTEVIKKESTNLNVTTKLHSIILENGDFLIPELKKRFNHNILLGNMV